MPRVRFERTVRADRERVFGVVTDYGELPRVLPEYFPSVRIRSRRGDVAVVEEHLRIAGRELIMMTKHVARPPESHETFVIGGDAKGSRITERYEEVRDGTKITVSADIRLGGAMRIAGLFGRRRLSRDLEGVMDGFARAVEG